MTRLEWLKSAERDLTFSGISTARLDALVLLEDVTGIDRVKLLAEPDVKLKPGQKAKLEKLLNWRAAHEPLAYIRGKKEFYGREFVITSAVLEPRPESETMIDELKSLSDLPNNVYIADVGTGSGALGITAKLEVPNARVELIDIDANALKVAKTNVDKFTLALKTIQGDLLATTTQEYDVLLCNLPYIPDDFQINTAAGHEPRVAIFGGKDGLDLYRKLFQQLHARRHRPLYLLFESLPTQHDDLQALAESAGYELVKENDFIQALKRIQK